MFMPVELPDSPAMTFVARKAMIREADPRLLLPVCLGLVILAFSAPGWPSLVVVTMALCAGMAFSGQACKPLFRACWALRWLLLFTLLMHLLLSPGQTMFGSRWLSYDGLLRGLFVCLQITVAVLAASLLTSIATPERLASTLGWFLSPLKKIRCPVDGWLRQLTLVLHFIPRVQAVFSEVAKSDGGHSTNTARQGRLVQLESRLLFVVDQLIAEASILAQRIMQGDDFELGSVTWPQLRLMSRANFFLLVMSLFVVILYLVASGLK
ncbi:MAG: hypothetical protein C0614_13975 [Desulfuromonas sp.]|nr:MAG: hypothetical protein C0614_13975 [Desulfuromonas sp.]